MKFKVTDVDIATGGTLVAILNKKDATMLDLNVGDRLRITKGKHTATAVLDIAESSKAMKRGRVGLMEEVLEILKAKHGSTVNVNLAKKPKSLALIRKKLEGKRLSSEDMDIIVQDIVDKKLTDIEKTYFVAAGYTKGLDLDEIVALTKAMIHTGDVLDCGCRTVVDKHCIGGVPGNRTTMIVVPILLAAGYCVPKTSSRSITSPAGTADTMEVLCNVDLDLKTMMKTIVTINGFMAWGGSVNLAPADDQIIHVEHPLSIDSEGQLLASILAKKGSVGATHILVDIPVGRGAKVLTMNKAKRLKDQFVKVGRRLGMKIKVIITDGSEPIGNGIGPALEARDVLYLLKNDPKAPLDLKRKSLLMAADIMKHYPLKGWKARHGYRYAKELLESGKAWEAMKKVINAQGKKATIPEKIKVGQYKYDLKAPFDCKISHIDNKSISRTAKIAGAPFDKGAGIYLYHHVGDRLAKGDKLMTLYAENKTKMQYAKDFLSQYGCVELKKI